ncbi:MAG: rhodanese-like domain-containing protein [Ktedonobacterales bacterium]|nr:rhodanese-like domain-containing protein [Ktedonobacterales bacterium]
MTFQRPTQVPTISAADVQARLTTDDEANKPLVVDVREPDEWAAGHIAGARHIPLGQLAAHVGEMPKDRDIVLVCHMGMRSERATQLLRRAGFDRATNMTGGMDAWEGQHLPIEH